MSCQSMHDILNELPVISALEAYKKGDMDGGDKILADEEKMWPPYPPDSEEEIVKILVKNNFIKGCCDYKEYSRAKKIIVGNRWLRDCNHYDRIIDWICNYLNL